MNFLLFARNLGLGYNATTRKILFVCLFVVAAVTAVAVVVVVDVDVVCDGGSGCGCVCCCFW